MPASPDRFARSGRSEKAVFRTKQGHQSNAPGPVQQFCGGRSGSIDGRRVADQADFPAGKPCPMLSKQGCDAWLEGGLHYPAVAFCRAVF
jgi:hypothetical protein